MTSKPPPAWVSGDLEAFFTTSEFYTEKRLRAHAMHARETADNPEKDFWQIVRVIAENNRGHIDEILLNECAEAAWKATEGHVAFIPICFCDTTQDITQDTL